MFFDEVLLEKSLKPAWRAGNSQKVETDIPLLEICKSLDKWFDSEDTNPRKRMSLRTSAVLLNGVTKLHRDQNERLLEDVIQFHEEIKTTKRRKRSFEEDDSSSTEGSSSTEEQNIATGKKTRIIPTSEVTKTPGREADIMPTRVNTKWRTGRKTIIIPSSGSRETGRKANNLPIDPETMKPTGKKTNNGESNKSADREKNRSSDEEEYEKQEETNAKSPFFSTSSQSFSETQEFSPKSAILTTTSAKINKFYEKCSQMSNEY